MVHAHLSSTPPPLPHAVSAPPAAASTAPLAASHAAITRRQLHGHRNRTRRLHTEYVILLSALLALALASLSMSTAPTSVPFTTATTRAQATSAGDGAVALAGTVPGNPPARPARRAIILSEAQATRTLQPLTSPGTLHPSSAVSPPTAPATAAAGTSTAPSATSTSGSGAGWGLPDPTQWVQQVLTAALTALLSGLLNALQQVLAWASGLHTSSFNFVTLTPPAGTYASSAVMTLWRWVVGVADGALVLLTLVGGYNVMLRSTLGTRYASAMELLPRLALAALAANLSLVFASFFIDVNNALCDGVGQIGLPGYGSLGATAQTLAGLLLALIYGIVGFLLVLQMLLRLALLDILIVTAPLGLLCWALPQTQEWARLWTSTFVATVLVQFLQVLVLKLGASLILQPTPGQLDTAVLTLLAGIADLYLTLKLPGWLRNWALRSVGAASVGGVVEQGMVWARAAVAVAAAAA